MISKIKTYLKTYLKTNYKRGQSQKWWRRENVEIRLEFFESLNGQQIFSCEIVNRELENGFSSENDLEHSLQVNRFSPEWVLGVFYKVFTREGKESFWKWLLHKNGFSPINGFSPKMVFPRKWLLLGNNFSPGNSKYITFQFNLRAYSWLRPMWILSLLFVENVLWQCLHTDFLKIK